MKPLLTFIFFLAYQNCFSQCSFLASLDSSGNCVGSKLTVNTAADISQIEWYNGNTKIATTLPSGSTTGITVAGQNGQGSNNDQLDLPSSIYVDASGNMYICEINNHRVQLWLNGASNGTTVAGGNGSGSALNQLYEPEGVFVDASGNVYVSDYANFRIQKWSPGSTSGITVAGGNGMGSNPNQFDFPIGIFVDAADNIYVSDNHNHRVQLWLPGATTGITVAGGNGVGSGSNQLNYAMDVFVDGAGNVYVADLYNNRVQKWPPGAASGITVAGGNGAGNASNQIYPYAIWVDNSGNVYVCDSENNRIQKWAPGATEGITVAGGNGAGNAADQFSYPKDIFVDSNGYIYVVDQQNHRIQKWSPSIIDSSYLTTVPGNYSAVVTDKNGCKMITNQVTIYPPLKASITITSAGIPTKSCGTVVFNSKVVNAGSAPQYQWRVNGIIKGKNTNQFSYSNWQNGDIVDCVLVPSYPCSIASSAISNRIFVTVSEASAIDLKTTGTCLGDTLFVNTTDSLSKILWYNESNLLDSSKAVAAGYGVTIAGGNGNGLANNQLSSQFGIFLDKNGDLYVADTYNNRIQKWVPGADSGITVAGQSTIWGTPFLTGFDLPIDVAVDLWGNIYVSDGGNGRIVKWLPGATSGVMVIPFGTGPGQINGTSGITVDPTGNLYVVDPGNSRVQMWAPGATEGITVAGGNGRGNGADQFDSPLGITLDSHGNIFVADVMNQRVQMWAPGATSGVTVAGGNGLGGAANQLHNPFDVCVDREGNVYVLDYANFRVQKWAPGATEGITVAGGNGTGSADNQIGYSAALIVDSVGDVYISDIDNSRIQKWSQHYRIDTTFIPTETGTFHAVVINSSGCTLTTNTIEIHSTTTPEINISVSADTICTGANVVFSATQINGGTNPVYKWTVNGISKGTNSPVYITNALNNGDIVKCILNANSPCAAVSVDTSNSIDVTVISPSSVTIKISASDTVICPGDEVVFNAVPVNAGSNVSYQWLVNGIGVGNQQSFTSKNLNDGDIVLCSITGTNECGSSFLSVSNSIMIKSNQVTGSVRISPSANPVCSNQTVNFNASALFQEATTYNYQWTVNGVNVGLNSSSYTAKLKDGDRVVCGVTADNACGVASSDEVIMKIYETPIVSDTTYSIQLGESIQLKPGITGQVTKYEWTPSNFLSNATVKNPVATPAQNTTYQLKVSSERGCTNVGVIQVNVFSHLYIPAAFTPNADGKNDIFYILGSEAGSVIADFSVFNRWGQIVFSSKNIPTNDPSFGWNGYYKGEQSPSGVYIYQVTVLSTSKVRKIYKGYVTLLR